MEAMTDTQLVKLISKFCEATADKKLVLIHHLLDKLMSSNLNDELLVILHDIYEEAKHARWDMATHNSLLLVNECQARNIEQYGLTKTNVQLHRDESTQHHQSETEILLHSIQNAES